ncbi:MAG: sensor histidine kinase [Acidimicrobiales bacterium]
MRVRLTLAMLALVAATLVVTSVGSYYFIRRAAISTARQEIAGQARAISKTISDGYFPVRFGLRKELRVLGSAGAFTGIRVVHLNPSGTITGRLPQGLTPHMIRIRALLAGRQTTGSTGNRVVFTAIPAAAPNVTSSIPLLVITRTVRNPADGLEYFILVGAIALLIAAALAVGLAWRFTRPLFAAVDTTRRIAGGDLEATVPVTPHLYTEFIQLAESINAMGSNLGRARNQERQFLLSVSHELRTPLTSIRGYSDAIIDGIAEDPVAAAAVINGEARRLERLVQDLLDLARLDADRFSLDIRPVDCADIVRRVVEGFRLQATDLGLELITAPVSTPLWVDADADRLGQIVANLLENASSFADRRIEVGTGMVGGFPAVWVVDDGPGIAPGEIERIFDRHYSSGPVGGRGKGSGLGLAIVSELAAAMGAAVTVESPVAEGRGSRMVVRFPRSSPRAPV